MKLILVSNRLPVNIVKENGEFRYTESAGGLATGMRAYVERMAGQKINAMQITWLGWAGAAIDESDQKKVRNEMVSRFQAHPVFLAEELMDKFYLGFCNKTIWPLFHYFPSFAEYEGEFWEVYQTVNQLFCEALTDIYQPGDLVWIHDYHLMLLPAMFRKKFADATIGFFLHIPFPSYEVYRLLPRKWRKDILMGIYGSDLIGFHTHDYRSYFLISTLRILGLEDHMGEVMFENRLVKVDSFPMGIDYAKYHEAAKSVAVRRERRKVQRTLGPLRLILSIDRQDYSKGILKRILGFELFLSTHPEWKEKVVMMIVVVPSRIGVEHYQLTKSQIDELVGRINGKYGNVHWTPILYQYRSLRFNELIAAYSLSEVALVTPLRDGMNLIAKEFLAARIHKSGVLILSEMAGSADELAEAIIINPNNLDEISDALLTALQMPRHEQAQRLEVMQKRLMSYDIFRWADDFLTSISAIKIKQERLSAKLLQPTDRTNLLEEFTTAKSRLLFLDYDGTLVPFTDLPEKAKPDKEVLNLLRRLTMIPHTEVVVISGRDHETLEKWLGHLPLSLVAEHGILLKEVGTKWKAMKPVRRNWKKKILPILKTFAEKLPGSFIEDKHYTLSFHYRKSEPRFAELRVKELLGHLMNFISNLDIQVLQGDMVLEIRNAGIDKGVAAMHWLAKQQSDFILAMGDDQTDEDLFRVMPPTAYSIKVGLTPTYARFNITGRLETLRLLNELVEIKLTQARGLSLFSFHPR